jgi:hypothetical protein
MFSQHSQNIQASSWLTTGITHITKMQFPNDAVRHMVLTSANVTIKQRYFLNAKQPQNSKKMNDSI